MSENYHGGKIYIYTTLHLSALHMIGKKVWVMKELQMRYICIYVRPYTFIPRYVTFNACDWSKSVS